MIKIICDKPHEFYENIADSAYKYLGVSGNSSIELVVTNGEEIRKLNCQFRNVDKETDVLSFPLIAFENGIGKLNKKNYPREFDEELNAVSLGSIVINEDMAEAQANEYGHSVERERAYLFLHGLLHIFGYDHMEESDKRTMRRIEERILAKLGLSVADEGDKI